MEGVEEEEEAAEVTPIRSSRTLRLSMVDPRRSSNRRTDGRIATDIPRIEREETIVMRTIRIQGEEEVTIMHERMSPTAIDYSLEVVERNWHLVGDRRRMELESEDR